MRLFIFAIVVFQGELDPTVVNKTSSNTTRNEALYARAARWIQNASHVVVFTGAGISVESGIPPFRGENGLWSKYDPVFLNTSYFQSHASSSWKLIKEIFYDFFGKAKSNAAHEIIAKWEKAGIVHAIITQNIDNLHQEAGSKNVIEFHGTAQTLTCCNCGKRYQSKDRIMTLPPLCPDCDGLLKPDFVFFNEPIPQTAHEGAIHHAKSADIFILVGTTGEIMPASLIPYLADKKTTRYIEINIAPTKYTRELTDIFLEDKATDAFMKLDEFLND